MFHNIRFVPVLFLATIVGCCSPAERKSLTSAERRRWKNNAVQQISRCTNNADEVARRLAVLRTHPVTSDDYEGWLSDRLILMKNGDWLCYENNCAKEESRIHDLFLAKGSDGTWYYSTFHFCVRMLNLKDAEQPESIAQFVNEYSLRPFDRQSEVCLQETWPKR
jgi:hypothetical protein